METKFARGAPLKATDKGLVRVRFATLNVVDYDGDMTVRGAFEDGAKVKISGYGHSSWAGALPVGRGVVHMNGDSAEADLEFFLDTAHGRDTFNTVKGLGDLSEWSYGFDILDSDYQTVDGKQVRILKRLRVHEISPVLIGAGINTATLEVKRTGPYDGLSPRERGELREIEFEMQRRAFIERYGN